MYNDLVEKLKQVDEVEVSTKDSTAKLKKFYRKILNTKLKLSTWATEANLYKFWIFRDGTVLPVTHSHADTVGAYLGKSATEYDRANEYDNSIKSGMAAGAVNSEELSVYVGLPHPTEKQISALKQMYIDFKSEMVVVSTLSEFFRKPVKDIEELDYFLRYGNYAPVDEAVATKVSSEKQMAKKYARQLNMPLKKSTYPGYEGHYMKFWLLTDGTIVPVIHSHADTAYAAGLLSTDDLYGQGALAGYINLFDGEAGLRSGYVVNAKLTTLQIAKMKQLYDKYGFEEIVTDLGFSQNTVRVSSASEVSNYLRYGKGPKKKAWEATATKVSPEQKMVNKYRGISKKLVPSEYTADEVGRCKFWLLSDGMIIPVKKNNTHASVARHAGTGIFPLLDTGAIRGYVKQNDEMGIHWESGKPITSKQKSELRNLFIEYKITAVHLNRRYDDMVAFPRSSEEFDYFVTYGTLDEAVATEVLATKNLVNFYKEDVNKPLKKCNFPGEEWYKFWLAQDGTVIPVEFAHLDTVDAADIDFEDLEDEGTAAMYITEDGELGMRGEEEPNFSTKQIIVLLKMQKIYGITSVQSDFDPDVKVDSPKELSNFLRYGAAKKVYEDVSYLYYGTFRSLLSKIQANITAGLIEAVGGNADFGFLDAGWIHPDGRFEVLSNYRPGDHDRDAFKKLNGAPLSRLKTSWSRLDAAYVEYLGDGHIRFISTHGGFNIELVQDPTESQLRAIRKGIKICNGDFFFTFLSPDGDREKCLGDGKTWKEFIEIIHKHKVT